MGNPILLKLNEGVKDLESEILVDLRQAETLCGIIHSSDVFERTEESYISVDGPVSLETLKNLGAVVKNACGRVNGEIVERYDPCIVPALVCGIVHDEHMVGKYLTEAE